MNLSQKQIALIGAVVIVAALVGALIYFNIRPNPSTQVQLTVWGFEKSDVVAGLVGSYSKFRPNVRVAYQQVNKENYENALLGALASGKGPDVFPVYNRGLSKNINILSPADTSQFGVGQVQSLFPAEVENDFTSATSGSPTKLVYALPLYFDTLTLVYNKELFDQGGVATPPTSWTEFQNNVAKLRDISANGQITKAGAAIGGSKRTVGNAVDILNVLMLQNGAEIVSREGVSFATQAGYGAFDFYLQFANPASSYYTWNESQQNDLDSFAAGKTAIVFAYNSDIQKIKEKSPFLRFGIAPLPQTNDSSAVNYADYWGLAVSKQTRSAGWAWDFVIYMTTQPTVADQYSTASGNPPALRELINKKLNDPVMGVFAKQALTARSWKSPDANKSEEIFNNAISSVLNGQFDSRRALEQAQGQISQLLRGINN